MAYLCLIQVLGQQPEAPPGIWPSPGHPAHPIAPGGTPGFPSHPIYWPPYPDQGLPPISGGAPGYPSHPIAGLPGAPTHPIVLPPGTIPDVKPEHPIYIPPAPPGVPTHPIVMPPPGSAEKPEILENWDAKTAWTPQSGWVVAIVPSEDHPGVPTPSKPTQATTTSTRR
jgi:hypothetical protein